MLKSNWIIIFSFPLTSSRLLLMSTSNRATCGPAERNKPFILDVLKTQINAIRATSSSEKIKILEIASGTGEHAAHFGTFLPDVIFQPTEPNTEMHDSINAWCSDVPPGVVLPPIALDLLSYNLDDVLTSANFARREVDVMICTNMIHISPYACTESLFKLAGECLTDKGFLLTYGPYRVNGEMTESNVNFDNSLRSRNAEWGIRDLETVKATSNTVGMDVVSTIEMPANNLCIIFKRNT